MASQLKYIYSEEFFGKLIKSVQKVLPDVQTDHFLSSVFTIEWDNLELKQRMRHIAHVLHQYLDSDYKIGVKQLIQISNLSRIDATDGVGDFAFMFLPDYIEVYGLSYFDESMAAMQEITQFTSCEFAIRPFFIKYPDLTLEQMISWSKHPNAMVRRLSSEGSRPRLPWAMALPDFKNNPKPILPILELLKNDDSESVRRSVANNLNDISKDNPDLMFNLISHWSGESKEVDWVIKHASRTLLKQGLPQVMTFFGYCSIDDIELGEISINTPEVKIGDVLNFDFSLKNISKHKTKVRIEYGIYFMKANGQLSKKVFKISEKYFQSQQQEHISRNQNFKIISTRKLYLGEHRVSLIINGIESKPKSFSLV